MTCPVIKGRLEQQCLKFTTKRQIHWWCSDIWQQCIPGPCSGHQKGTVT